MTVDIAAGPFHLMCKEIWNYVIIIFLFSMGGALFIASFNALIQCHAKEGELGKILTGNNFIQNIGMLLF